MERINLSICDIIISIELPANSRLYLNVPARYKNFIASEKGKSGIYLDIKIAGFSRSQIPGINTVKNETIIKGPGLRCILKRKKNAIYGKAIIRDNIYSFDTLLRLILSQTLLEKKGFLVHACGLYLENKGILLAGKSGSGKTTLSKKMPENKVLSDELVCIRHYGETPYLTATPFRGEFGTPGINFRQKLNAIYFLNKESRNRIKSIPKDVALKCLLKLILFFSDNPTDIQILLKSASKCIMHMPCYNIYLTKNIDYAGLRKLICSK